MNVSSAFLYCAIYLIVSALGAKAVGLVESRSWIFWLPAMIAFATTSFIRRLAGGEIGTGRPIQKFRESISGGLLLGLSLFFLTRAFHSNQGALSESTSVAPGIGISVVLGAIFEEMFFRGMLIKIMTTSEKIPEQVIWIQAFLFAVCHLNVEQGAIALVAGVLFGKAFQWTGSLLSPILAHTVLNAMAVISPGFEPTLPSYLFATSGVILSLLILRSRPA